jgi:hypothetical protein
MAGDDERLPKWERRINQMLLRPDFLKILGLLLLLVGLVNLLFPFPSHSPRGVLAPLILVGSVFTELGSLRVKIASLEAKIDRQQSEISALRKEE